MCRHQCRHHLLKWQVPKKTKIIGHKVYNFELVGMKFSSMSLNFHDKKIHKHRLLRYQACYCQFVAGRHLFDINVYCTRIYKKYYCAQ